MHALTLLGSLGSKACIEPVARSQWECCAVRAVFVAGWYSQGFLTRRASSSSGVWVFWFRQSWLHLLLATTRRYCWTVNCLIITLDQEEIQVRKSTGGSDKASSTQGTQGTPVTQGTWEEMSPPSPGYWTKCAHHPGHHGKESLLSKALTFSNPHYPGIPLTWREKVRARSVSTCPLGGNTISCDLKTRLEPWKETAF